MRSAWTRRTHWPTRRGPTSTRVRATTTSPATITTGPSSSIRRTLPHYYGRATTWGVLGDFERALEDYTRAIELDPKSGYLRAGRAWAHQCLLDYDKALADYDEAVRLDPANVYALGSRAWILAACSDPKYRDGKKAVELARKACELTKWNEPAALTTMAAACAETGDFDAAVKWQTKANDLYKDDDQNKALGQHRLKLYREKQPYHDDDQGVDR